MGKTLAFKMQRQRLSRWCWAATVASVCDFYKDASYGSQCAFVSAETGLGDCCQSCQEDGEASRCNRPHYLGSALWDSRHGVKVAPDLPDLEQVKREIDASHPVACNTFFNDGDVHALVICGYTDDGLLFIADPEKPGTLMTINSDFIYSATHDTGSETGRIREVFRTR